MEMVETEQEYVDMFESSRNPPFLMVDGTRDEIVFDFETAMKGKIKKGKNLQISNVVRKPEKLNIKDSKKMDVEALLRFFTPEKQQFNKNLLNPDDELGSELQEAESEMEKLDL
ncbi:hypothetical protein AVEN_38587-1 [Araneus ventricosus]|uniref:Uncharacterized protein n=1 Tax=Araneus ventricosus TaxID=182803 RepID=A0A4Y2UCN5_ARAVE|nr:hypothetical protein AVEN_38587-1 [Araneus ventricosus]